MCNDFKGITVFRENVREFHRFLLEDITVLSFHIGVISYLFILRLYIFEL